MVKKFNDNQKYFDWFNKNGDIVRILKVDVKDKIIVRFEKKEVK